MFNHERFWEIMLIGFKSSGILLIAVIAGLLAYNYTHSGWLLGLIVMIGSIVSLRVVFKA